MNSPSKVPVTILTGFLGSGKTTLLNRILSEEHGKRIAVIENEYGEVGIDQALVINADEEIFEMSNGCICCTVRGDLIRVLGNLMKRRDKFDYILLETTGLADPGPVAQTFFMDDEIASEFSLDGIVTLVDAHHINQQLGRSQESTEQIAFADVILLNKTDLVKAEELDELETRLREMNRLARVHRCERANVAISTVLNLEAFNLDQVLADHPTFLEPEYPFEWTGVYALSPGSYELSLDDGPDPTMSLVMLERLDPNEEALQQGAEWCVRRYAEPANKISPGNIVPIDQHVELQLQISGQKSFAIEIDKQTSLALFAQHTAEEFNLRLGASDNAEVLPVLERTWVAQHEHDDEVGSVAIEVDGDVNPNKLNAWLGFLSIAGESERFVFQGVHMLFDGQADRPWGNEPRHNQLVFIGRNLDENAMKREFEACLN
jgi:G3E family GTPase